VKSCLHTPEGDRVAHGRFDEVGQSLELREHRLEFGTQLRLDAIYLINNLSRPDTVVTAPD